MKRKNRLFVADRQCKQVHLIQVSLSFFWWRNILDPIYTLGTRPKKGYTLLPLLINFKFIIYHPSHHLARSIINRFSSKRKIIRSNKWEIVSISARYLHNNADKARIASHCFREAMDREEMDREK